MKWFLRKHAEQELSESLNTEIMSHYNVLKEEAKTQLPLISNSRNIRYQKEEESIEKRSLFSARDKQGKSQTGKTAMVTTTSAKRNS